VHTRLRERRPDSRETLDLIAEPTVAAVVVAYNEQDSVAATIEALLGQSRVPDSIFVIVNNATDQTFDVARRYNGRHVLQRSGGLSTCVVTVVDIGVNDDGKVGALNFAWSLAKRHDFLLSVDADTVLDVDCLFHLLGEYLGEPRLGGVSAVSIPDQDTCGGVLARALVRAQRVDAAADALRALIRGGGTVALDGRCSLLRSAALAGIAESGDRHGPWIAGSGVENLRLTGDLLVNGYEARVSERARARTAPTESPRSLRMHQMRWSAGNIRLTLDLPLAARVARGAERRTGLFTHLVSRLLAAALIVGFAATGGFEPSGWWLVPVVLALLADVCVASRISGRSTADIIYAAAFLPHEAYRTVKGVRHARTWVRELGPRRSEPGAASQRAERGIDPRPPATRGFVRSASLVAAGCTVAVLIAWNAISPQDQQDLLAAGAALLAILLGVQSLGSARTIVGSLRGYRT
jgi:biofilm PGA synthesis N-glycosyltransferase PgaC